MIKWTKKSPVSGEKNSMELDITWNQVIKWQAGGLVQEVMPDLSVPEREFLITGMTPEEQDDMYYKLEEDEDDE